MAKKIKKAILAGLTAYAASKMLGKGKLTAEQAANMENIVPKKKPYAHELEKYISSKKPEHLGDTGKSMNYMLKKKSWRDYIPWFQEGGSIKASVWKKHGGAIRTEHARMGKMIKAAQGTYAREDESLGMRLGKGKGTAKERDMSYGDWGKRKTDWAKKGKMVKARFGTEVRTDGSNPHVPSGGTAYVKTKLNGTLKTKTF